MIQLRLKNESLMEVISNPNKRASDIGGNTQNNIKLRQEIKKQFMLEQRNKL